MFFLKENKNIFTAYFFICVFLLFFNITYGEVMTGSVYEMESDSINFAGSLSTTTLYSLEDSIGEISTGYSSSTIYDMHAGLLQSSLTSSISISVSTEDITMSPALGGLSGGYSNGSVVVGVTTDNSAGYELYIQSEMTPALQSLDQSISDYTPSGSSPDYDFNMTSSQSLFGFSLEGDDVNSRYKNDGISSCGTGSTVTSLKCWDGLSTSQKVIANSASSNNPNGIDTTINFRVGIGSSKIQENGWYYATTTITAVAL